jgi:serine/threonine protein kinase
MSCKECSTLLLSFNKSESESKTIQMVDPAAITLGSGFGTRYRVESLLGQGGTGRVYEAYDKDLEWTVALQVVGEALSDRRTRKLINVGFIYDEAKIYAFLGQTKDALRLCRKLLRSTTLPRPPPRIRISIA